MEGKLSDQGQLNIEFYLKEVDFNTSIDKCSQTQLLMCVLLRGVST